jgi:hypothetical protein
MFYRSEPPSHYLSSTCAPTTPGARRTLTLQHFLSLRVELAEEKTSACSLGMCLRLSAGSIPVQCAPKPHRQNGHTLDAP